MTVYPTKLAKKGNAFKKDVGITGTVKIINFALIKSASVESVAVTMIVQRQKSVKTGNVMNQNVFMITNVPLNSDVSTGTVLSTSVCGMVIVYQIKFVTTTNAALRNASKTTTVQLE